MRNIIVRASTLGLLAATWLILSASAQAPAAPAAGKAQKVAAIAKQLNLTPQQEKQLMPILEADAPKIQAIKNNQSLGPLQKLEQIKAIHAQSDPQVKAILNPQQYQQLQDIRQQEIQEAMQKRMSPQ
jgi:Spy/CpxP family protein refolding chaperone